MFQKHFFTEIAFIHINLQIFDRLTINQLSRGSYFGSDNRLAKTQPAEPAPTMIWLYSFRMVVEVEKARLWELPGMNTLWCIKDLCAILEIPLDVTWRKW